MLPSAKTFADALYQAQTVEEQEKQLLKNLKKEAPTSRSQPPKDLSMVVALKGSVERQEDTSSSGKLPSVGGVKTRVGCNVIGVMVLATSPETAHSRGQAQGPLEQARARGVILRGVLQSGLIVRNLCMIVARDSNSNGWRLSSSDCRVLILQRGRLTQ